MRSVAVGTAALWIALAAASVLTFLRRGWKVDAWAVRLTWIGIAVQTAHALEERLTDFPERFPALLGLDPWPAGFFETFNAAWIVIWIAAALAVSRGVRLAVLPVWFLALAMVANGVGHPLMALAVRGYFPGLWTSPVEGVVGWFLLRRWLAVTAP
jgi:hypothetical protein